MTAEALETYDVEQDSIPARADEPLLLTRHTETKSRISTGVRLYEPFPISREHQGVQITADEERFRHESWASKRLRTFDSLCRLNVNARRLERFANCGACLHMQKDATAGGVRFVSDKCHDRCCVPCGGEKSARIVENLCQHMEAKDMRLVTLTQRHNNTSLSDQVDRLYRNFNALRRRVWWLDNVKGGAAFMEVKVSDGDGRWHVHLHLLCEGNFIDQRVLSTEWLAVTGDSSIVHVTRVKDFGHVGRYVVKYVTKPLDSTCFADTDKLDEAVQSLKGRRLCYTWGRWRGFRLLDIEDDGHTWTSIGSPFTLFARIRANEPGAAADAAALLRLCPALGRFLDMMFGTGRSPPSD